MKLRVKILDMDAHRYISVLNEKTASKMGEGPDGRLLISKNDKSVVTIINTTNTFIEEDEVGVFKDVAEILGVRNGEEVEVFPEEPPISVEYIRKKIMGETLSAEEIKAIIMDVVNGYLFPAEASAFVTACQINGLSEEEVRDLTVAIAESGNRVFLEGEVVDKHSIGGIPGNRITFFYVPIMASLGYLVPKTSSRAITSPSGTADTMEVFARVDLTAEEIEEIVKSVGGVIAWGGGANIAAADDKLIQIRRPLRLDPLGLVLASIMAKKYAVSSKYMVLDIPVGPEAKVKSFSQAKEWEEHFKKLGDMLGIKVIGFISSGVKPIGRGVGPVLEAIDILQTYERNGSKDLLEKGIEITGRMLAFLKKVPIVKARKLALDTFKSGEAEKKLRSIIEAQGGDPDIKWEDLTPGKYRESVSSPKDGRVAYISPSKISLLSRMLGAPVDKGAGIWIERGVGSVVSRGDTIITLYSNSQRKLKAALEMVEGVVKIE